MSVAAYNGRQNLFEVLADETSVKNFLKKSPVPTPPPPKKKETKKDDKKNDSASKQERTSEKLSEKQDQKIEVGFQEVNRSKPENKEKKNDAARARENQKGDAGQRTGEGRGNRQGFEGSQGRGRGNREGRPFGERQPGKEGFVPRQPGERKDNYEGGRGRGREFKEGEGGQGGYREGGRGYREGGRGYREGGGEGGQGGYREGGRGYREGGRGRGRADENRVEGAEGAQGAQGGFKEGGGRGNYEGRRRNYEGGEGRGEGRPYRGGEGGEGEGGRQYRGRREGDSRPFRDSSNFYQQSFESAEDNPNLSAADIGIPREAPTNATFRGDRRNHNLRRERTDILVEDPSGIIKPKVRVHDRKSGTGRPLNENKKQGAGKGNWGSLASEGDLAEDTIEPTEPAEVKTKPAEPTEGATAEKPEGSTAKTPEEKALEDEAKQITLSEYLKQQAESKSNITLPQPRKAAPPSDEWADAVPLTREAAKPYSPVEKIKKKEKKPDQPETKVKHKTEKINVEFKVKQKQPTSKYNQERNEKRFQHPAQPEHPATEHHEEPSTPAPAPAPATTTDDFPTLSKKA